MKDRYRIYDWDVSFKAVVTKDYRIHIPKNQKPLVHAGKGYLVFLVEYE